MDVYNVPASLLVQYATLLKNSNLPPQELADASLDTFLTKTEFAKIVTQLW